MGGVEVSGSVKRGRGGQEKGTVVTEGIHVSIQVGAVRRMGNEEGMA